MKEKLIDKNDLDRKLLNEILEILGLKNSKISEIENVSDVAKSVYHFVKSDLKIEYKKFSDLRYPQILTSLLESFLSQRVEVNNGELSIALIEIKRQFDRNKKEALVDKVEVFLAKYNASKLNWLILDANGNLAGKVNSSRIDNKVHVQSYTERANKVIERQSLQFSPTQQWLSKILILNGINKSAEFHSLWPVKYKENIHDYKVLSKVSGVSESTCFNFIKLLEARSFLNLDKYEYQFNNLDSFFELWKSFSRSEKKKELFLTPRKPFGDMEMWQQHAASEFSEFCNKQARGQFVMGGHLACRAQGLDFSNNISSIFYVPSLNSEAFENLMSVMKVRSSDEKNGDIRVIVQKKEMPILKIDEIGESRHFFADPIQLMFDVEYLGGRGKEQSDYIYEKVLLKHFRSWQWQS